MKIKGTRSYIIFDMEDGHRMKAQGELLTNRSFVVYKNTMIKWEPPYSDEKVTEETVDFIISAAEKKQGDDTMQLIFE